MSNEESYAFGNCTWYVAQQLSWIPAGLGDGGDWLANAKAKGLPTSTEPVPGSVVVYGRGGGYSEFGHVAIVKAVNLVNQARTFTVSEMNYNAFDTVDTRTSNFGDVLGFILPPNSSQPIGGVVPGSNPIQDAAQSAVNNALGPVGSAIQTAVGAATKDFLTTMLYGFEVLLGTAAALIAVAIMILVAFQSGQAKPIRDVAEAALPGKWASLAVAAGGRSRASRQTVALKRLRSPRKPARAPKASGTASSSPPAEKPAREPNARTVLRRQIAQARKDRREAGPDSKSWVNATVRLNMARRKLGETA